MKYRIKQPFLGKWVFIIESASDAKHSVSYSTKGNAKRGLLRFLSGIMDDFGVKWNNTTVDLE